MNIIEENEYNLLLFEEELAELAVAKEIKRYDILNGGYIHSLSEGLEYLVTNRDYSTRPAVYALEQTRINNNLEVLNELAMEQIAAVFEKFIAAIKNMVSKFVSFAKEQMGKQKQYLIGFKDKILGKPKKDIPIEMKKYSTGIARISRVRIPEYEAAKAKIKTPGDKNACEIEMKRIMIPAYTNANVDFKDFCKSYFQGGNEVVNTNINEIDMNKVYNYCTNFGKTMGLIQRDANMISKMRNVIKKLVLNKQAVPTNQQNGQMQAASGVMPQQNIQPSQQMNKPVQSTLMNVPQQSQVMNASATITAKDIHNILNEVFNEADAPTNQGMVVGQPQSNSNVASAAAPQNQAVNSTQAATDNSSVELNVLQAYKNAASQVIAGKMYAANLIYKDYCTLMRTHAPESGEKKTGTQSNSLQISDPQGVANQIQAIQNMKDKNQQATAIAGLVQQVQQENPGFNGSIQDIAKSIGM